VSSLRAFYEQLKEDPRYNEEYKAAEAWKRYEATKDKIAANKQKAKEELHKQLISGERFSIPMPGQEGLTTNDANKLLASQNEATRIVRKLDRMDASASGARKGTKGFFQPDKRDTQGGVWPWPRGGWCAGWCYLPWRAFGV
jgi:hypothetical protein